jgi:hypothetical protein
LCASGTIYIFLKVHLRVSLKISKGHCYSIYKRKKKKIKRKIKQLLLLKVEKYATNEKSPAKSISATTPGRGAQFPVQVSSGR